MATLEGEVGSLRRELQGREIEAKLGGSENVEREAEAREVAQRRVQQLEKVKLSSRRDEYF